MGRGRRGGGGARGPEPRAYGGSTWSVVRGGVLGGGVVGVRVARYLSFVSSSYVVLSTFVGRPRGLACGERGVHATGHVPYCPRGHRGAWSGGRVVGAWWACISHSCPRGVGVRSGVWPGGGGTITWPGEPGRGTQSGARAIQHCGIYCVCPRGHRRGGCGLAAAWWALGARYLSFAVWFFSYSYVVASSGLSVGLRICKVCRTPGSVAHMRRAAVGGFGGDML